MYEVAPVAGNKFEAACALRNLQTIMGQISSHHHNKSSRQHDNQKLPKKFIYRNYSEVAPEGKSSGIQEIILRYPLRESSIYRRSDIKKIKDLPNGRPVTISEMNAYNIEKNEASSKDSTKDSDKEIIKTIDTTTTSSSNKTDKTDKTDVPNEFYTVGDGYHKTDTCYYRGPDGNFHKLPSDSFHKMSEGCYIKIADGSFRRLENNSSMPTTGDHHHHHHPVIGQAKVKSHMMRFLKRSRSHTPGTIKEMQKEKERERERERELKKNRTTGAAGGGGGGGGGGGNDNNRKVVVTMMENGGLPIVATSKADRSKHTRDKDGSNKSRDKVNQKSFNLLRIFSFI